MNADHSFAALMVTYAGAFLSWFTQSHVLGLLTAIFTLVNIAIGVIKLKRMLKEDE